MSIDWPPEDSLSFSREEYKERLNEFDLELHYCEYCGQLFPSGATFSAHRKASTDPSVKKIDPDDGFEGKELILPGEMVGSAVVGKKPCSGKSEQPETEGSR